MKNRIKLIMLAMLTAAVLAAALLSLGPLLRGRAEKTPLRLVSTGAADGDTEALPPMYLQVDDYIDGRLYVTVSNQSGYNMNFNNGHRLERMTDTGWSFVELDGRGGTIAVPASDSFELDDMEQMRFAIDLSIFGEPERGRYRINLDSMSAEFELG